MHSWIRRKVPSFSLVSLIFIGSPTGFVSTSFIIPFLTYHQIEEKWKEGGRVGWVDVSFDFLLVGLGEPKLYQNLVWITMCGYFTWRVSDCEELVGGQSQEIMGDQILCRFSRTNQKTNNPVGSSLVQLNAPPVLQHRIRSLWLLRLSVPESCVQDRTRLILP